MKSGSPLCQLAIMKIGSLDVGGLELLWSLVLEVWSLL
jgi:hypothetical protein